MSQSSKSSKLKSTTTTTRQHSEISYVLKRYVVKHTKIELKCRVDAIYASNIIFLVCVANENWKILKPTILSVGGDLQPRPDVGCYGFTVCILQTRWTRPPTSQTPKIYKNTITKRGKHTWKLPLDTDYKPTSTTTDQIEKHPNSLIWCNLQIRTSEILSILS